MLANLLADLLVAPRLLRLAVLLGRLRTLASLTVIFQLAVGDLGALACVAGRVDALLFQALLGALAVGTLHPLAGFKVTGCRCFDAALCQGFTGSRAIFDPGRRVSAVGCALCAAG
ncbi:hypothetical protein D3C76_816890 [compost metagenome]